MRERLFVRASEFVVSSGPFGAKGITLVQQFVYGKPAGWMVRYERGSSGMAGAPPRVIDWDGTVVWDQWEDDEREQHFQNTRFSLEDALALCDRFDLWSCQWVQGRGYVNARGTWVGQERYADLRVPDNTPRDPRLDGIMEECFAVASHIDEEQFSPGDGERLRTLLTEWDQPTDQPTD